MYEQEAPQRTIFERISLFFATIGSFIFSSIEAVVVALAISVVLYLFLMTPHEVVGTSMVPNFQDGEHLVANKLVYNFKQPERGDVVIFKYSDTRDFIKRVIAVPGDTLSLRDGRFYINNRVLDESKYLDPSVYTSGGDYLREGETIEIPSNHYFVVGDNRPHSSDSRVFGPVDISTIKAKAWVVYFPFDNLRVVEHVEY